MIVIEPRCETIERTAERAISIARFANEPVRFVFNGVDVIVKKKRQPLCSYVVTANAAGQLC